MVSRLWFCTGLHWVVVYAMLWHSSYGSKLPLKGDANSSASSVLGSRVSSPSTDSWNLFTPPDSSAFPTPGAAIPEAAQTQTENAVSYFITSVDAYCSINRHTSTFSAALCQVLQEAINHISNQGFTSIFPHYLGYERQQRVVLRLAAAIITSVTMYSGINSMDYRYFAEVRTQVEQHAEQATRAWQLKQATLMWLVYMTVADQSLVPEDEVTQRFANGIKALQPIFEPLTDRQFTTLYQGLNAHFKDAIAQSTTLTPELSASSTVSTAKSDGSELEQFMMPHGIITSWLDAVYPAVREPLSDIEKQHFFEFPAQVSKEMAALGIANRKRKRGPAP